MTVACVDCGSVVDGKESRKRCDECRKANDRALARERYLAVHGAPSFICVNCNKSFEGNKKRTRCEPCKAEFQKEFDRKRSQQRRNTPSKIECSDCGKRVDGDRRRKRCDSCVETRNADLQRSRRGTPDSFTCQRCGTTIKTSIGENPGNRKWCDTCGELVNRDQERKRYEENPEKYRSQARGYYSRDIERSREKARINQKKRRSDPVKRQNDLRRLRMRKYGISMEEATAVEAMEGSPCPGCKKLLSAAKGKRLLCVDHDHETGEVRGVLCTRCNTALGLFGDSGKLLSSAIDYLRVRSDSW